MNLSAIQQALKAAHLDGWFFFDHHHRDPLAYRILGLPTNLHASRRWYYLIPAVGEPRKLVHRIEAKPLDGLPGGKRVYSGWKELGAGLEWLLSGQKRVAAQYSPGCAVPLLSMIDGGTLESLRGLGVEVISSGDLIQEFEAKWSDQQIEAHFEAGRRVDRIRGEAFDLIRDRVRSGQRVTECEVADYIRRGFSDSGLISDHGPIVGVNGHAGDPHYEPTPSTDTEIKTGDFVLIDMWAKLNSPGAVFYDITWTGFCGPQPSERIQNVFRTVVNARDAAVARAKSALEAGESVAGFEIDDAARQVIENAGFGDQFVHRTGHSIGEEVHGAGANMDNLETHEERKLIPGTCFSVEPGVYLPDFGVRSEVNVLVQDRGATVTGQVQHDLLLLF